MCNLPIYASLVHGVLITLYLGTRLSWTTFGNVICLMLPCGGDHGQNATSFSYPMILYLVKELLKLLEYLIEVSSNSLITICFGFRTISDFVLLLMYNLGV